MKRSLKFYSFIVFTLVAMIITQSGVFTLMDNPLNAAEADGQTVALSEGTNISVAVSPEQNDFIIDLQGVLWSFSTDNENAERITGNYDDPALPNWSPDGDKVVFQSYKSGNYHIWSMNPDGSDMKQLTTGQYDHREPRFSPDGDKIAFSSDRGGSYDIWVLDLESDELLQWTDSPEDKYQPTWSPDGNEIAFVTGGNTVKAIDQNGKSHVLVTEDNGTVLSPSWSPNGDDILYVHQQSNESNLKMSGEQITTKEDVFPFPAEWLSGNEIVYTADGKVKQRDIQKSESKTIPFKVELTIEKPDYQYKDQDFDSDAKKQVKGIVAPTLSPNGKQIAFVALNDLWLLDIGKEAPKKLTDDMYYVIDPAWSPDGKKIAYSSDKSGSMDIYIKDLQTGQYEQLTALPGAEVAASWSPDGTKIAFQDQDGATYTIDIADGKITEVLEPLFAPGPPTWGPNSDIVTIGAVKQFSQRFREGTNQILNVNLGTGSQTFVDPIPFKSLSNRVNSGPVWSPDGKTMAFTIESTLWVMEVDSKGNSKGEPRQITEEVAESPSWSGDSETLLYLSNGDLKTVSTKTGKSEKIPFDLKWQAEQTNERTVIHVGKLWDGQSKDVQENMDIIVEGNRITNIKPHDKSHKGDYVDASDLTVIPGLWDAHVHQELSSAFFGSRQGRQLLSYGITSTISMGDPAYLIKEEYEAITSGARMAPRLFTSGEPIDGSRVYYDFMRPTTSKEQFQLELERAKEMDYDILKTYVRLPFDYQEMAIDFAHNNMGVPTFSHYWNPSMAFGQDGTSHISATQRLGFSRTQSASGFAYDDIIKMAAASEMAMTTTLFGSTTLLEFNPEFLSDERVKALYTPWQYETLEQKYNNVINNDQTSARTSLKRDVEILKNITNAGGTILGGTDIPLVDVAVSLHLNMQAMERYGMTPYDVLRTVTYLPAKEMGVEDDLGTIEVGKLADLVFVDGDPLDNIKDASNVRQVMKNGKMYTIDDIIEPYTEDEEDISASIIRDLVEQFAADGEITRNNVISVLTARLDTVDHFENKGEAKKVIKHINGFKDRLDHHLKKKMIPENVYNTLTEKADALINKWQ